MKKRLLVLFLVSLVFTGCTVDDPDPTQILTMKIDNVFYHFDINDITPHDDSVDGVPYTRIEISSTDEGDNHFGLAINRGGGLDGQIVDGTLFKLLAYHLDSEHPLTCHLTVNNQQKIKGTFSGTMITDDGETAVITDGIIDILY